MSGQAGSTHRLGALSSDSEFASVSNPMYIFAGNDVYYDRGDADEVENWLFWGPQVLETYIRVHSPPCEHDGWDLPFGGMSVDTERKRLVWFSGGETGDCPFYCRLFLKLQRALWPEDWVIEWAGRGLDSLLTSVKRPKEPKPINPLVGSTMGIAIVDRIAREELVEEFGIVGAASVRSQDGSLKLYAVHIGDVTEDYLWVGADQIVSTLANRPSRSHLTFPQGEKLVSSMGGFHLDLKEKLLGHWHHYPEIDSIPTKAWPGWTIIDWEHRFEEHVKATDGKLQPLYPPMSELLAHMEQWLVCPEQWNYDPYHRKYPVYDDNDEVIEEVDFPVPLEERQALWQKALKATGLDKPPYPQTW